MVGATQLALELTEAVSTYMGQKFLQQIHHSEIPIHVPSKWDTSLLYECNLAVDTLARAFNHKSRYHYPV